MAAKVIPRSLSALSEVSLGELDKALVSLAFSSRADPPNRRFPSRTRVTSRLPSPKAAECRSFHAAITGLADQSLQPDFVEAG